MAEGRLTGWWAQPSSSDESEDYNRCELTQLCPASILIPLSNVGESIAPDTSEDEHLDVPPTMWVFALT